MLLPETTFLTTRLLQYDEQLAMQKHGVDVTPGTVLIRQGRQVRMPAEMKYSTLDLYHTIGTNVIVFNEVYFTIQDGSNILVPAILKAICSDTEESWGAAIDTINSFLDPEAQDQLAVGLNVEPMVETESGFAYPEYTVIVPVFEAMSS